ncbi:MAG: MurR/RpiR family transcriptional regulator [Pseudomonadota bacterium]
MDVRHQIEDMSPRLTASERKLAAVLLADYPFAGLEPIQAFAEKTHVSAPSITRFVQKLGCGGYLEFQRRLISELKEDQQSPVELRHRAGPVSDHFLGGFLDRASDIVKMAGESVTEAQFERVCAMLSDQKRSIHMIGGRISDPIAQYLSRHLRQVRRDVFHIPSDPEVWPEYLLRMRPRDVLYMVDFRRYEQRLADLARNAAERRGAQVILVTDKWLSPISSHAREILAMPIESGTAWDSYCAAIAVTEAMIARVADQDWDATQNRIKVWDSLRLQQDQDDDEN